MVRDGRVVFCSKLPEPRWLAYPLGALKGEIIDKTSARTGLGAERQQSIAHQALGSWQGTRSGIL